MDDIEECEEVLAEYSHTERHDDKIMQTSDLLANEERVEFFKLLKGTLIGTNKVFLAIYEWGGIKDNNQQFEEYFTRRNSLTLTEDDYQKLFEIQMCQPLQDHGSSEADFDTTTLYSIIQKTCRDIAPVGDLKWWKKDDTQLEYLITSLNNMKNYFLHESSFRDKHSFFNYDYIKTQLFKTISAAANRYHISKTDVNRKLNEIEQDIETIRMKTIKIQEKEAFSKYIKLFQMREQIRSTGKIELQERYKKWLQLNPTFIFKDIQYKIEISSVFPQMKIEKLLGIDVNLAISCQDFLKLFSLHSQTNINHLQSSENGTRSHSAITLLEGPAGSGKTTILKFLISEWIKDKSSIHLMKEIDLLLFIECRNPNVSNVEDFLITCMPTASKNIEINQIKAVLSGLRLLILIDGPDELNSNSEKLIKEIVDFVQNTESLILCSIRPESIEEFYTIFPRQLYTTHVRMFGISRCQRGQFVHTYFPQLKKGLKGKKCDVKGLLSFLEENDDLIGDQFQLPLNLVLLMYMWIVASDKITKVRTKTALYKEIHNVTVKMLMDKLTDKKTNKKDLKTKLYFCLDILYRESLVALCKNEVIMSEDATTGLAMVCGNQGLSFSDVIMAFLKVKPTLEMNENLMRYSHPHKSFQEFLSAKALFKQMVDNNEKYYAMIKENVDFSFVNKNDQNEKGYNFSTPISIYNILRSVPTDNYDRSVDISRFQNTLLYLIGLISDTKDNCLEYYTEEIIYLLSKSGINTEIEWFNVVLEVKCDELFSKQVARQLNLTKWRIHDYHVEVALLMLEVLKPKNVLNRFMNSKYYPDEFVLKLSSNPRKIQKLEPLLKEIARFPSKVQLLLDFDFHNYSKDSSDDFLNILNNSK